MITSTMSFFTSAFVLSDDQLRSDIRFITVQSSEFRVCVHSCFNHSRCVLLDSSNHVLMCHFVRGPRQPMRIPHWDSRDSKSINMLFP